MQLFRSIHRALGAHRLAIVALASLLCLGTLTLPSIAAQPTVPPQPTQPPQPTEPPLPTLPPQPTQPPPPTQPGPPTEAPTEQPTETPTEQPTEQPTGTPTEQPTEAPTEAPTAEPTAPPPPPPPAAVPTSPPPPRPTDPPTPEIADEARIDCEIAGAPGSSPGTPVPMPDVDAWTLYTCELALDFGPVESLALRAETATPGWRVILVDEDAPDTPGLLNASNERLDIDGLDGESTAAFLIGVETACTAFKAATVDLDITGTRPGPDGATIETAGEIPLTVPSDGPPDVTLESLTFADNGDATFAIGYVNAPADCGWQLLVTLDGDGSGTAAIGSLTGPDGTTGAIADGLLSILIPAADDASPDGTIEVGLQLTDETAVETVLVEAVTFP